MVTWKVLYSGDREEKGTRTTTPNHADKTQPVQHSRAEGPCRRNGLPGQQHLDPAGVALGRHSQAAPPGGSLHYSHNGKRSTESERQHHVASRFARVYTTSLSREQSIFPGRQRSMAEGPHRCPAMQVGQAHGPGLPFHAHTQTEQDGRTWRSLRSAKGRDLLKVTREDVAPLV